MSAALPAPGSERALYILDLSAFVFRAYYAVREMSNSKGEPTHAVHGFTAMLFRLLAEARPTHFAVAMDTKEPSFRKQIYDAYKANRPPPPPDLSQQMERCKEVARTLGLAVYEQAGVEADDLIATLTRKARADGYDVVIVSADKDLLQLVGDGVVMYDSMREKVFGPEETREKMGVPPAQVRDLLALTGDSSDNVPGVPSVGPKTAARLLADYGDLDSLYARLAEVKSETLRGKLVAHKADAYLSQELVTLKDDLAVAFDDEALRYRGPRVAELDAVLAELELSRLRQQLRALGAQAGVPTQAGVGAETGVGAQPGVGEQVPALGAALRPSGDAPSAEVRSSANGAAAEPMAEALTGSEAVRALESVEALVAFLDASRGAVAVMPAFEGDDALVGEWVGLGLASSAGVAYAPVCHRRLDAPAPLAGSAVLETLASASGVAWDASDSKAWALLFMRHGRVPPPVRFDALLASYVLDPSRRAHDVAAWAEAELGVTLESYDAVTEKQRGSQRALAEADAPRLAAYAGRRAAAVRALRGQAVARMADLGLSDLYAKVELPLARVLATMERTGVRLDVAHLARLSAELKAEIGELERRAVELAGREFNVNSPRQLETILFDELGLPVVKKTKTARSTDHEVLEELAGMHELPKVILEHRTLAKLLGTYVDALPTQVDAATGRVHTRFNQAVAATGRLSSSDPGLQNIPIRTEVGRRIRQAFVPEAGWELISADYSQIELRVLAHLSEDEELCEAFGKDEDVHVRTATALFGVGAGEVTREQRAAAKTVNFAVIYGQTQFALAKNLDISQAEAARYIEAFFARYRGVKRFMDHTIAEARETGVVTTMLGRRRPIPDLQSKNRNLRMAAERMAGNTPIQGTAADIMKLAMVALEAELQAGRHAARLLLTVHDELVLECPPDDVPRVAALARDVMSGVVTLKVPLLVEVGHGPNWDAAH